MKNEIMYEGITGIREDIVLQAENYQFGKKGSKKNSKRAWIKWGDLVTRLGSTLEFSSQTASVSNSRFIEIVYQNFGFDVENEITKVELDVNEPHYYMEVRKVYDEGEENVSTD